uniref:prealbumin-like fold domain-containing protein n=1 Tax=Microbacterium sp. OVT16B TaxID=2862682 RepID=UPI001CBC6528
AVVPMDGSSWAIFSAATGGTAVVDPVPAAVSGGSPVTGLFRDVTLTAGTYWLEETRALDGFALLAGRVPFTVAADGTITLDAGVSSNVQLVDVDGIRTIRVEDVPALDLPDAGGPGDSWIYLIGLTLLLAGTTAGFVRSKRQRRAAIPSTEGIPDSQNRRNER